MSQLLKRAKRKGRRVAGDLGLMPLLRRRRINACCCGLSKTGTHSMAGIFSGYRSLHHPDSDLRLDLSIRLLSRDIDTREIEPVLKHRDRWLWLEMESSTLSGTLIDPLVRACPDKRYILTVRDVYTWTDSWIDHNLNRPPRKSRFTELDRIRLRVDEFPHTAHDRPLAERNCYALASFFHLWNDHNRRVLEAVPGEQLLVVRTGELLDRLPEIASFVGVPESTLRPAEGWQFAAPAKHHVLSTLDQSYVRDLAREMCGDLMDRWFPGLGPEVARP